jgi:hypothetical protein
LTGLSPSFESTIQGSQHPSSLRSTRRPFNCQDFAAFLVERCSNIESLRTEKFVIELKDTLEWIATGKNIWDDTAAKQGQNVQLRTRVSIRSPCMLPLVKVPIPSITARMAASPAKVRRRTEIKTTSGDRVTSVGGGSDPLSYRDGREEDGRAHGTRNQARSSSLQGKTHEDTRSHAARQYAHPRSYR